MAVSARDFWRRFTPGRLSGTEHVFNANVNTKPYGSGSQTVVRVPPVVRGEEKSTSVLELSD